MPGLGRFRTVGKLRALARFPVPDLLRYVAAKLPGRSDGGEVAGGDVKVRDSEVYRINAAAYDAYEGQRYDGHIDEITAGINLWDGLPVRFSDDRKGRVAASCERFEVDGDHMSLMRDPAVVDVAKRIRKLLLEGS